MSKPEPMKGAIEEFLKYHPEMRECVHFKELISREKSAVEWAKEKLELNDKEDLEWYVKGNYIKHILEQAFEDVMK